MSTQYQSKSEREDYDDGCADDAMSVGYLQGYHDALKELLKGLERGSIVHPCAYMRGRLGLNLLDEVEEDCDETKKVNRGAD